jgi:hypothetical protein
VRELKEIKYRATVNREKKRQQHCYKIFLFQLSLHNKESLTMKPIIAVYIIVMTCGLTHSYSAYGSPKRRANMALAPVMPIFSQVSPQYLDNNKASSNNYFLQPQYLSAPYSQQQPPQQQQQQQARIVDDFNNYRTNPNYYYYPQQQQQQQLNEYQEPPLYGIPTYHGDYNPKPYYFAQPSYMSQDDRLETTNPLDYLHEEILQENERERNNAAFMQNLAFYNKQLDSLKGRTQQLQQFQDMYNLRSNNEFDDYDLTEQPTDWYDQTSIIVEPSSFDSYPIPSSSQQYYNSQYRAADYDDEMVKELKDLKQHRNKNSGKTMMPKQQFYSNQDWQQDMPLSSHESSEDEPENYEDEWINWGGQKRSIQPKKDFSDGKQTQTSSQQNAIKQSSTITSAPSTSTSVPSTTERSKLIAKLHKGQKEVVLPRPATPVRRPFSESIMKSMNMHNNNNNQNVKEENKNDEQEPPLQIYKTIKQIIDMEQSLSHVSTLSFYPIYVDMHDFFETISGLAFYIMFTYTFVMMKKKKKNFEKLASGKVLRCAKNRNKKARVGKKLLSKNKTFQPL